MNRRKGALVAAGAAIVAAVVAGVPTRDAGHEAAPVVPDPEQVYSQDAQVLATAPLPPLYFFEQRARPDYRVVRFDPASDELQSVFEAPPNMLVFGLDVLRDRPGGDDVLVLAATTHPDRDRSGLYTVDLSHPEAGPSHLVGDDRAQRYWAHPEATTKGVAATVHDADTGRSAVVAVDASGQTTGIQPDALQPAAGPVQFAWLDVEPASGRRRVVVSRTLGGGGDVIEAVDADLDFPLVTSDGSVWVAVLEPTDETSLFRGRPAAAHGSHRRPSRWQRVRPSGGSPESVPLVTHDAVLLDGDVIIIAAFDGIHMLDTATGATTKLVHSRAVRYVAS